MGAWRHLRTPLEAVLPAGARLTRVSRPDASSPATGFYAMHQQQEQALLSGALEDGPAAGDASPGTQARARAARGTAR